MSAAGVALSAVPLKVAAMPVLYGDGLRDDTVALQHLIDGHQVVLGSDRVLAKSEAGVVRLLKGKFRLTSALRGNPRVHLQIANCAFKLNSGPAQPYPHLGG
ncbi:hypothetical protein [Aurantiacibacter poecillastricola]|uniref:hypothetical protein n=1 Tax=Aurantiacibacter poecillastricola TaxID=3064385 RepID=UPI00273F571F|nr:hypothetical protein [Aurantiacibacter sp. 219JJ12-13]MDP5263249.1 hypothetical protein [Aurantiacibacter sp. 219JJ12-13]